MALSWDISDRKPAPAVDSNFPTWSWISVDKAVGFLFPPGSSADGEALCFLEAEEEANNAGTGMDLVSVLQPELHVRAPTRREHLELEDSSEDQKKWHKKWHNFRISLEGLTAISGSQEKGPTLTFFPDSHLAPTVIKGSNGSAIESVRRSEQSSPFHVEMRVAWCGRHADSDSQSRNYIGLALAARDNGKYIRVSLLMADIPLEQDDLSLHTERSLIIIRWQYQRLDDEQLVAIK